ncbi:MAG: sigma-70 family RNA polymerase sigma factor [Solirubrobacterales bacterium]
MPVIEIGDATTAARAIAPTDAPALDRAGVHLRIQLREAADLRDDTSPAAPERRRAIWCEILANEYHAIRQQVILFGYSQSGSAWVNEPDVDDVTNEACIRATRMFEGFKGTSVGELYNAVKTCVRYAVIDYVRRDAAKLDDAVDPGAFDPGSHERADGHFGSLAPAISAASAGDRVEFKERLNDITMLEPRAATIVAGRAAGESSREIAERLGLTAANVDQIYCRSIQKLIDLTNND